MSTTPPDSYREADVTIRRAPKFGVFIVGGAIAGFVVSFIVVALTQNLGQGANVVDTTGTSASAVGFWGQVGYFSLWGITAGLIIGAVVAVLLDAVLRRRSARLVAQRRVVEPEPETVEGELDADADADRS
ncbi:hypothetical protein [Curtobacterium ammoniigenes]|uniref:hypothetical protein n=1 Tax=Curtobacterium ammoniigenes TaxID=395387 RepID=UPI0012EE5CFC|nr:hypothetical protein [Curtobacterium ammoniigenes]